MPDCSNLHAKHPWASYWTPSFSAMYPCVWMLDRKLFSRKSMGKCACVNEGCHIKCLECSSRVEKRYKEPVHLPFTLNVLASSSLEVAEFSVTRWMVLLDSVSDDNGDACSKWSVDIIVTQVPTCRSIYIHAHVFVCVDEDAGRENSRRLHKHVFAWMVMC